MDTKKLAENPLETDRSVQELTVRLIKANSCNGSCPCAKRGGVHPFSAKALCICSPVKPAA